MPKPASSTRSSAVRTCGSGAPEPRCIESPPSGPARASRARASRTPVALGGWALGAAALWAVAPAGGLFSALNGQEAVFVIAFLILSLGLHEAAHAFVANLRGDPTARDLGRMTLNQIVHIDPFLTIILPTMLALTTGFIFGGAKPVPVNPTRLKHPNRDMMLVAIAGPATNFLLALGFMAARNAALHFGYTENQLLVRVLEYSAFFNVILAVFNMLPIPPLDGSRVLSWILPPGLREPYVSLERFGMIIVLFALFFVPPVQVGLRYAITGLMNWMNEITWF